MAKVIAVTDAVKSLSEVEVKFGLKRSQDQSFFSEWRAELPELTEAEIKALNTIQRRLEYHRAEGDLLEEAVMLLVASPLLEAAGFYDPPFLMKAEAAVELTVDDGEEILRGWIDVLILQAQFWALVLESKKTTISIRSALPQILAYMMANPNQSTQPLFGCLTNGDDVLFIKLINQPNAQYDLSRVFTLYTLSSEFSAVLQILKHIGQVITEPYRGSQADSAP
mgnify:CR=1 FL=1